MPHDGTERVQLGVCHAPAGACGFRRVDWRRGHRPAHVLDDGRLICPCGSDMQPFDPRPALRVCPMCKLGKPVEDFGRDKARPDGARFWCKECSQKFNSSLRARSRALIAGARYRAKTSGAVVSLTREWLLEKLRTGVCERTGIPFRFDIERGHRNRANSFSPSLDRRDPHGPYSEDNVDVVCWIFNRAKGAFPFDDFLLMCRRFVNRYDCTSSVTTTSSALVRQPMIAAAFGGPASPQEPGDPGCKDPAASATFWREHALAK